MKTLNFAYEMKLHFSEPVSDHYFALRCVPADHDRQKISLSCRHISPECHVSEVTDGFGNKKLVGHYSFPHTDFEVRVAGTAQTDGMKIIREPLHPMYKYPSMMTRDGSHIHAFAESLCLPQEASNLEKAIVAMNALYDHMAYTPGSTTVYTTADEALGLGKGVCQDYAHILIALLRHLHIPARYANGMMIGEGFSHAWVELWTGEGWYGLDPTNNLHVDDFYIKLAHGRDFKDCVLNDGRFIGAARQTQEINVEVGELT